MSGDGETGPSERTVVRVDADIQDLVPTFLENRGEDVRKLDLARAAGDFQTVRRLGHSMKGAGGGYGFDRITEIGAELERAGTEADARRAERCTRALERYLREVEVIYE